MGIAQKILFKISGLFLLQLLCVLIVAPEIGAQNSSGSYTARIAEAKAKLFKLIQKETLQLSGFDAFATVPITYPLDICLMEVDQLLYAVCLSREDYNNRKGTGKVLKKVPADVSNPLYDYVELFSYVTRSAQSIDCISMGNEGFIAVVNNIQDEHYDDIEEGSPVFLLKFDKVTPVQYFAKPRQNRVHLLEHQDQLYMWQTFRGNEKQGEQFRCPIMKWSDSTFNEFEHIPCNNAMQIESFTIEHQLYTVVANYMDENENIETYSAIYMYDINTHKFNLTQKIKTFGAIDVKYIFHGESHFLFFANSYHAHPTESDVNSNVVVYRYEHSKFVPMQILPFEDEVTQLLPYLGKNNEFVLLVSVEEGATKTFQFDGIHFFETPVTFTGGSLGRGVAKMRTYTIDKNILVIVVANAEMYRDAPNLFQVKFTVTLDYDFAKAFDMFDDWYAGVNNKIQTNQILETFHEISALQPPPGFGSIKLENTKVNVIYTDMISRSSVPIDFNELKKSIRKAEELIANETLRRPKRLNDSTQNDSNISNVESDLVEEHLEMPTTLHVDELFVSESLFTNQINGHNIVDLVLSNSNLTLKNFTVDHLILANQSENFESIEQQLLESDKREKRQAVIAKTPLFMHNITIEGLINGLDFNSFVENTLKSNGNQVLETDVNVGTLKAKSIEIIDGKISNLDLSSISRINAIELLIRPPIRFTNLVKVNNLSVLDRLNQILIDDGKMDALFKRSRRPQVITGHKVFQSVHLLEPIILQGKINISNSLLNKIKPIVTVNDDIVLQGNVAFVGNVTIKTLLKAANIYGQSVRYNVAQLLADGLRLRESVIDMPLEFKQPIEVNDVVTQTQINGIPIESLIRRNETEVQTVIARKVFTSDLSIEGGHCDVKTINAVNLQTLNETMLKRTGKNQIVSGSIQFNRIIAKNVKSDKLLLGNKRIDRLLTMDTDQVINGHVTVHGNINLINNSVVDINNLTIKNTMFGVDVTELLDDSYFMTTNESIIVSAEKWFKNISIEQFAVEGDFWHIGQPIEDIMKRLDDLNNVFRISNNVKFTSQFNIGHLSVTDEINDIHSSSFGHEWLLFEGKQIFTVPQNFTNVSFNDNIELYGLINGHNLAKLVNDSVVKNVPASLNHIEFDNIVLTNSLNIGGRLSGIRFPEDLILTQSDRPQIFNAKIQFDSRIDILGNFTIGDQLNGQMHSRICEFLEAPLNSKKRLIVKGDVTFAVDPSIEYLNQEPFQHLLSTTWFADDQYVNFSAGVQFDNAIFEKPITTAGLVNDVDLQNLNDRYMSLSRSQKVSTPIRFQGRTEFIDSLNVNKVSLKGLITIPDRNITLNITDFDQNVLKNTKDTQFIRELWTVNEMRFSGILTSTLVNGLNFTTDVSRWSTPNSNVIRAPKHFQSLSIDRLVCENGGTVQGIDVTNWMSKAVMAGLNYTIQGTIYARNPILLHVEALGHVNNVIFNAQNILLKSVSQKMNSTITIGNRSKAITSLTFDNCQVNFINDKNITEFFGNVVRTDELSNNAGEIFSNVTFADRLEIENLTITGQLNGIDGNQITFLDMNVLQQYRNATNELDSIVDKLAQRETFKHFDRLLVRQTFPIGIQVLRKLNGYDFEFIAINISAIQFYAWNNNEKTLHQLNVTIALPEQTIVTDLTVLQHDLMHLLVLQIYNADRGHFVQQFYDYTTDLNDAKLVYEIEDEAETIIEPFNLDLRGCFIIYRRFNATQFNMHCMDDATSESQLKVHQINSERASEIFKITSGYANAIILWFINGEIESRWYDMQNRQMDADRRQFYNVTSVTAKKFVDKTFMAVCMHLSAVGRLPVEGVISIYRMTKAQLEHDSDIQLKDAVILQCEFGQFSKIQPILVVAIRKESEEMLLIYQYQGVNGFKLLQGHDIRMQVPIQQNFYANIIPEKRFTLIQSENDVLSFIIVYSDLGVGIIECTYT